MWYIYNMPCNATENKFWRLFLLRKLSSYSLQFINTLEKNTWMAPHEYTENSVPAPAGGWHREQ